jgi:hypothetical protein
MISNKNIFLGALAMLLVLGSCVKQKFTTPELAEFASSSTSNTGAYFIPDDPNSTFKVPIGITTSSDKDRVINFTITSPTGAAAGQQYTIGATSITIPAGKVVDSIPIKGIFAGYPAGRKDTLVFTITGGDAPIFTTYKTYTLVLQKYCNVVLNDLLGTYTNVVDYDDQGNPYGPYSVTVTGTSTGPTSAKLVIPNLAAAAFGPFDPTTDASASPGITVNLDWSNPANFVTIVPTQSFYKDATYGPAQMVSGTGTFSSCDGTLTLSYTVTVAAGSFGTFTTTLQR